jgi:dTDP-4-dehydrorhamnose 3,5-epimerase
MRLITTELPGAIIIEPRVFRDARGYFLETWSQRAYQEAGLALTFVQDNLSSSMKGVLRGMHYQHPQGQGKLVSVVQGEVFDVAVDIRPGSPTFGTWVGVWLSAENAHRFYVPPWYAHGFVVTSETALFTYKCTDFYNQATEGSIRWDDPDLGIDWPVETPVLSEKDAAAPLLREIPARRLPPYQPEELRPCGDRV